MNKLLTFILCAFFIGHIQLYSQAPSSADSITSDTTSYKIVNDTLEIRQDPNAPDPGLPDPEPLIIPGDSIDRALAVGIKSEDFLYTDTRNTRWFHNNYTGRNTGDVFYSFTLTVPMNVTMTHEGSYISNTCMYLLDSNGNLIESNDDYNGVDHCTNTQHSFIRLQLAAGTYYVVSEGYSTNGAITTNITGNIAAGYNYPTIVSTYSTQPGTAVGGMGGQFSVSPMGGAVYSIPIEVPQGVGGLQPNLSIVYNSQSGNGLCGYGASLAGISSITRGAKDIYHDGTAEGVKYLADDALYLDGVRLILSSGTAGQDGAVYNPESDPYTRVIAHGTCTATSNNTWFEVKASDGMIYWYGYNLDSRLSYTVTGGQRIHSWYMCHVQQPTGNYMSLYYQNADLCVYPFMITYGTNINHTSTLANIIEFTYEARADSVPIRFDGKQGNMGKRLKTITSSTNYNTYRSYILNYDTSSDGTAFKYSRLTSVTEKNGQDESLPVTQLGWSYLPAVYYSANNVAVSQPNLVNAFASFPFSAQSFMSGDFNGDGLSDIVGIGNAEEPNNHGGSDLFTYVYFYYASLSSTGGLQYLSGYNFVLPPMVEAGRIKGGVNSRFVIDVDGDGINELLLPYFVSDSYNSALGLYALGQNFTVYNEAGATSLHGNSEPLFVSGDIDNDGRTDVAFLETTQYNNSYPIYLWKYNTDYIPGNNNVSHALFDMDIESSLSLSSQPKALYTSDLNGNGLNDLFVICTDGYEIYWNQGNGLSSSTFSNSDKYTDTDLTYHDVMTFGDFNGDGLMDILTRESMSTWYFYLNNGNGGFTKTTAFYNNVFTVLNGSICHCDVFDFDGDGNSDVVITEPSLFMPYGTFLHTDSYWLRSNGTSLEQVYHATSLRATDALSSRFLTGDFDGDGHVELVNYGYDCVNGNNVDNDPVWHIYKNNNLSAQTGKVTSITGDFGTATNITYATLTDNSVYSRGTAEPYPAPRYTIPLNVIRQTVQSNGAAGTLTTQYSYEGLKAHLRGRGLLGFSKTSANCLTTGVNTENSITQWDDTYFLPKITNSKTTIGGSYSQAVSTFTILDKGQKKYFAYPSQTVVTDMDGNTVTTLSRYDAVRGVPLSDSIMYGADMYRSVNYSDYVFIGGAYRAQTVVNSQLHADDTYPFSTTTKIGYDHLGEIISQAENYGSSSPLTTIYSYDLWGNVTYRSVSGDDVEDISFHYKYDLTHRFPLRIYTSPSSSVHKYTYDLWGNVLTESDSINSSIYNTITYTYDNWGTLIRTQIPGSGEITYTYGWSRDASQRWYVLEQGTSRPWVKTWYDNCGREVMTQSAGPMNVTLSRTRTFDSNGLLTGSTESNGNLTFTYSYSYDARGRLILETDPGGHTLSYQYGNRSVTVTENNTNITTQTFDAWGNLKTLTAPVSGLTNTYASCGSIKTTASGGSTWTFAYDDRGNRTSMYDPDAGTTTYICDALGRETGRTDGRGVVFVTNYDYLGRITSRSADNDVTQYTYGTSGTGQMRLVSESNYLWTKNYEYDQYGRLTEETMERNMAEFSRSKTYQYNTAGLLSARNYPDGRRIGYSYDAYGNCTAINAGTTGYNYLTWTLTANNGSTSMSSVTAGSGYPFIRTTQLDSNGHLQSRVTTRQNVTLQNDSYSFGGQTGDLISRTINGVTQSFSYDLADRLTGVTTGQNQVSMTYSANGNIVSKSDVGQYSYNSTARPHAVTAVDFEGSKPYLDQWLIYDSWGKPYQFEYSKENKYYYSEFEYGPDQQRVISFLSGNYGPAQFKFKWDEYEEYYVNDTTFIFYWIEAPDGLAGMLRYTCYNNYDAITPFVATTDHLGSLTALFNQSGSKVHEASYDAWGKRTLGQVSIPLVTRGFTGHDHMEEFDLIDMKGRMYDPNIGRFLSPDNFIQSPYDPQNYNRYSYCINNPLKYTDPDGESITAIVAMSLIACGMTNLFIQANNNKIDSFYDVCKALVGGAAAGLSEASSWALAFTGIASGTPLGVIFGHGILLGKRINFETTFVNSFLHPINTAKTILGRYYTDENRNLCHQTLQGLSRFTWEGPQTWAGYNWSNIRSIARKVDKIDYQGGATFCMNENGSFGSVSLGNYINADLDGSYEGSITKHPVLMHEYGHTFDSHGTGPAYLFTIGIPSMKSASKSNKDNGYNHRWFWTELRANKSAKKYYNSYFGVDWSIYENNIYSKYYYPTIVPQAEEVKAYIKILLNN